MPLWLDLLRTPMAAPETPSLRRLRYLWQAACLGCAVATGFFAQLHRMVGRAAPIIAGLFFVAAALLTAIYLLKKHRADTAFLDRLGGGER